MINPTILLRDEFEDTMAAGAVNGTLATDGVNTRTVADTESKLSISSGTMSFAGGRATPNYGDPSVWYPAITRTPGLIGIWQIEYSILTGKASELGFDADTVGSIANGININSTIGVTIKAAGAIRANLIAPLANNTDYTVYIILRSNGFHVLISTGGLPLLAWIESVGSTSALYASLMSYNATFVSDSIRVAGYWLPVPIVSDGFSTNGTSDGLGHAETSGIGSGGGGISWSNVGGGWSVSGGKAINTPSLGSELITNGDFSSATGWTQETGWVIATGVATATAAAGNSVYQSPLTSGKWYKAQYTVTSYTSGAVRSIIGTINGSTKTATGTYIQIARAAGTQLKINAQSGTFTGVVDDVSTKELTLSSLLSLHASSTPDVFSSVDLVVATDTQAGLALNWDSSSNPQNGVIAYADGTNVKLEKCVAGVWTTVLSAVVTHSAGMRLVVSKIGSAYRVYCANALVGSATISDAGIINNTLHGRFLTDPSSNLDNYTVYASGTGGEYATAFDIVVSASGQSNGAGAATAAGTAKRLASGQSNGAGAATAAGTAKRLASGQSDGTSAATGAISVRRNVSGQSNGIGAATGIGVAKRLASGQSNGTGTATATSSRKRTVSGVAEGSGTATIHNYTVSATISS